MNGKYNKYKNILSASYLALVGTYLESVSEEYFDGIIQ